MRPVRESFKEKQAVRELNVALGPNSVSVQKCYCLDLAIRGCPFFFVTQKPGVLRNTHRTLPEVSVVLLFLCSLYHWS